MRWRSGLFVVAMNALVLLGLLAVLEGGARLLVSHDARPLFADQDLRTRGRPFVEPHPDRGFALIPGFADEWYQIDDQGFRIGEPVATADALTIIALGESTTFGWGVGNADTYPAQLQALFAAQGQAVRVVNAGVPSYSSSQVLRYLQAIVEDQPPDAVLINILWNDVWYSTVLNWYPALLVYQQPPLWLSRLLQHSALVRALVLQAPPDQEQPVDQFNAAALAHYQENLQAMVELAADYGVALGFVEPPFSPDLMPPEGLNEFHVRYTKPFFLDTANQYRAALQEVAADYNVPVIDHRLSLTQGGSPAALFLDLLHPTAEGNRLMAEDVLMGVQLLIDRR